MGLEVGIRSGRGAEELVGAISSQEVTMMVGSSHVLGVPLVGDHLEFL